MAFLENLNFMLPAARKTSKKNFKKCQICKKAFPSNSKLRRHEKGIVHLKKAEKVSKASNIVFDDFVVSPVTKKIKKDFKECQICKKVFPSNWHLKRHEKVHVEKAGKVLEAGSEVEVKNRKSNKSKLVEDSSSSRDLNTSFDIKCEPLDEFVDEESLLIDSILKGTNYIVFNFF